MTEDATVKITLDAIYSKLLDVEQTLHPLPQQVSDHEIRLRAIEKYMWIWIGAAGILGAGLGQIVNVLLNR